MDEIGTMVQLIASGGPLGVSIVFIMLYWKERKWHRESRQQHIDDLRHCAGKPKPDVDETAKNSNLQSAQPPPRQT